MTSGCYRSSAVKFCLYNNCHMTCIHKNNFIFYSQLRLKVVFIYDTELHVSLHNH